MLDTLCKAHSIGVSYKICEKAWIYNFEFCRMLAKLDGSVKPMSSYSTVIQYFDGLREYNEFPVFSCIVKPT